MEANETKQNVAVLFCTCSGAYPSMAKIDFWALAERVRLELGERIDFMALHPRLCEEDGERLIGRVLGDDLLIITPACAEKRQVKLLREGFAQAEVTMDAHHWLPVSMAQEDTDAVFSKIKKAMESLEDKGV